ncbi:MAG: cytochrome b/b6 domain-containing protein, partial [Gammaproteobacteria bacterium]
MADRGAAVGVAPVKGAHVWDWPTRVFHWLLAGTVTTSWITGTLEVDDFDIHLMSGYSVLGLVVFRLTWGLIGSGPSRFASFVRGPLRVMRYAAGLRQRSPSHWPGHNPLGGWSVVLMLLVLAGTVAAGLFSDDEVLYQGPLAALISEDGRATATEIHELLTNLVLVLV